MDRAATEEAAGEARAKAAEAISGRRGSCGSEAWAACCYYCTDELHERVGRDPPMRRGIGGGRPSPTFAVARAVGAA